MNETSPIPESGIGHKLTEREVKALEAAGLSLLPRPEYAQGEVKLDYKYTFATGEVFSATEDEQGVARLVICEGTI